MRKAKRLLLNRETVRLLAVRDALREAAGGVVTSPVTACKVSICIDTCKTCSGRPCTL